MKMKTKVDNQNMLDSTIGLILTNLYFKCNSCNYSFHRLVVGIVRRFEGKLLVSHRDKPDKPFKVGRCTECGSKDIIHVEFL